MQGAPHRAGNQKKRITYLHFLVSPQWKDCFTRPRHIHNSLLFHKTVILPYSLSSFFPSCLSFIYHFTYYFHISIYPINELTDELIKQSIETFTPWYIKYKECFVYDSFASSL